jgi:hypothetical protein
LINEIVTQTSVNIIACCIFSRKRIGSFDDRNIDEPPLEQVVCRGHPKTACADYDYLVLRKDHGGSANDKVFVELAAAEEDVMFVMEHSESQAQASQIYLLPGEIYKSAY